VGGEEGRGGRAERCRLGTLQGCWSLLHGGAGAGVRREQWLACAAHILLFCLVRHRSARESGAPRNLEMSAALWKNLGVAFDQLLALHPDDSSLQASRVRVLTRYAEMVSCFGGKAGGARGGKEDEGEGVVEDAVARVLAMEGVRVACPTGAAH
jgi:hypothetical protein